MVVNNGILMLTPPAAAERVNVIPEMAQDDPESRELKQRTRTQSEVP